MRKIHGVDGDYEPVLSSIHSKYGRKDARTLAKAIQNAIDKGASWDLKLSLHRDDGSVVRVRSCGQAEFNQEGNTLFGTLQNIEEHERRYEELETIFENLGHGINVFDERGHLCFWNKRYLEMFNKPEGEIYPGITMLGILLAEKNRGKFDGDPSAWSRKISEAMRKNQPFEQVVPYDNGRTFNIMNRPLPAGGWVCIHQDISESEAIKRKLEQAANHDQLTGLLNRHAFEKKCEQMIAAREDFVLVMIDLDKFKPINDKFGHLYGDRVLKLVSSRLSEHLRGAQIGRLGGDEFAAIYKLNDENRGGVREKLQGLIKRIEEPCQVLDRNIEISASIGAAFSEKLVRPLNLIFHEADMAMYRAKQNGGGEVHLFDGALSDDMKDKAAKKLAIMEAIQARDFEFHFQPVEEARSRHRIGFEMLLRWSSQRKGWYSAPEIIDVAENNNMIEVIGNAAITKALDLIVEHGIADRISVNVSPLQLGSGRFLKHVTAEFERTGVDPDQIEMEITESNQLEKSPGSVDELHKIKDLGVKIALDDFGTGFATLHNLQIFPFDRIKIDRSFVKDVMEDRQSMAIVSAIFTLAKNLGMTTTAEGIETEEQYETLRIAGATHFQGYLLGKPEPIEHYLCEESALKKAV